MKKCKTLLVMGCAAFVMMTATACKEKGPLEKAGAKVDDAAQKTGDAVKDAAEKTKDKVNEATQ